MKNNKRPDLGLLVFIMVALIIVTMIGPLFLGGSLIPSTAPTTVTTSEIVDMIENGEIESMIIVSNSNVKATTKDGKVYTAVIDLIAEGLLLDAAKNSPTPVRFSVQQEKTSIWITILGNWIPILAMIFFLMFMFCPPPYIIARTKRTAMSYL